MKLTIAIMVLLVCSPMAHAVANAGARTGGRTVRSAKAPASWRGPSRVVTKGKLHYINPPAKR